MIQKKEFNKNSFWHTLQITKKERCIKTNQKPFILWFTGISGSGKSTIANALEEKLHKNNNFTYLLDGDNIRHGLNKDLGFNDIDRFENIRRVGEVAKLFVDSGLIILASFISPFIKSRKYIRSLVDKNEFIEIFIDVPLKVCEARDPKGLYKQARSNKIKNFTAYDSTYQPPVDAEIHIINYNVSVDEVCNKIINFLLEKRYITWKKN